MAAAAYAFLVSLLNTMDQIQIHPLLSTCFDNFQFESLREKVDFLVDFVENHSDAVVGKKVYLLVDAESSEVEDLLSRIAVTAQKAEDIIEVEAADQCLYGRTVENTNSLHYDLHKIVQAMDCIIKDEVIQLKEERRFQEDQPPPISSMAPPSPSSSSSIAKTSTTMVGFDGYLERLLDELTGHCFSRCVIPIVGMGGIGKTTLARNVFQNSLIVEHFDVRVWVTVSQSLSVSNILLQALSCLRESSSSITGGGELGEELHKTLYGRRYLIVLDDMWSVQAWEDVKFYFPDNDNGSRIIVTTRQQELVSYFGSSAIALNFLHDIHSWELFCDKTFAHKGCPPELEGAGKKIVRNCEGLPLAITVIGGLLGKSPMTPEYWEKIARDQSVILKDSGEGNKVLSILYSSYKNLPVYLKPCFLCMGLFPKNHRVHMSRLIQIWVAQGFIKGNGNQSMEEVAESYIKNLVDRNLLLCSDFLSIDRLYFYYFHDVVRELCLWVAAKENFYCVQRLIGGEHHLIADERNARWCFSPESLATFERPSLMRPLPFSGQIPREAPFRSRLLRVCFEDIHFLNLFPLVNLRFFMNRDGIMPTRYLLPSSISLCWSLQTLILYALSPVVAPSNIWKMPQLRHIDVLPTIYLDNLPEDDFVFVLHNLQTLKKVMNLNMRKGVCKRIPNIKDLEIHYELLERGGADLYFNLHNLECLNRLEMLKYSCRGYVNDILQNLKLPTSLKELTLNGCHVVRGEMAMIASLPHLQILNLCQITVVESGNFDEEEGFPSLKHLEIAACDGMREWSTDFGSNTFPVLETLSLQNLLRLEDIPSYIGEIPTLKSMYVYNCSETATWSAVRILEEQESLGNEDLRVSLHFASSAEADKWRKALEESSITCQKLQLSSWP